jgi:pimeloyl-ACP methyl ester carboxylesterase
LARRIIRAGVRTATGRHPGPAHPRRIHPDGMRPFGGQDALESFELISHHGRGFAGSSGPLGPTTIADHAADAIRLLDHLGVDRAHVVGHSSCAAIALEMADTDPSRVASLSLLEPPTCRASPVPPSPSSWHRGPPITTRCGHCWFLGGEIDDADGVRQAVRELVARGVDVIKVMASGGNMTPPSDRTSPSSDEPNSPSQWRRRTPPGCPWPCTRTAAKPWRTRSLSVRTRSSTAPSSAPTASTPTPTSCNSSLLAVV